MTKTTALKSTWLPSAAAFVLLAATAARADYPALILG